MCGPGGFVRVRRASWGITSTSGVHVPIEVSSDRAEGKTKLNEDTAPSAIGDSPQNKKLKPSGGKRTCFPLKLHDMLDMVEAEGLSSVVSWQPHGRCFVVHKKDEFVAYILPRFFKQGKWESFQRQLNLYGFSRFTQGRDKGGYYHVRFLRGMRQLSDEMVRMKIKGTRTRKKANPEAEPNFYAMPSPHDSKLAWKEKGPESAVSQKNLLENEVHEAKAEIKPCPIISSVLNGMNNSGQSEIGDSVKKIISKEESEPVTADVANMIDDVLIEEKALSEFDTFFSCFDGVEIDDLLKDDAGLGRLLDTLVDG